ncbi:enoyl-CoA hydratase-related protein [Cupriavidus basilensis]
MRLRPTPPCVVSSLPAAVRAPSARAPTSAGFAPDIAASPEQALRSFLQRGQAMTRRIEAFPKPVIAAVNGLAFGGGCETVEACSLAIAAGHATFAKPRDQAGLPARPSAAPSACRVHVGRKRANEMILTRRAHRRGHRAAVRPGQSGGGCR